MDIIKQIENYENPVKKIKFALSLNEVLCPVQCVLSDINPKIYYNLFKTIHRGKVKRIKMLEENFRYLQFNLF